MEELTKDVNWLATVVGAVLAFGLGALWYSEKMFGTKWMAGVGLTTEDIEGGSPGKAMVVQGIGTFLYAWVIAVTAVREELMLAILVILMVTILIKANGLFAGKSKYAICTESSYALVMGVIMIACHAIF